MPGLDHEHPDRGALTAFLQGRVGAAELNAILSHLEGCEACRGSLEGAADDAPFLSRLRQCGTAIALDGARKHSGHRLRRAANLAHLGERARAVAAAEKVLKEGDPAPAGFLLLAASVHAVAAAGKDEPEAERYAARAVALLRRAADLAGVRRRADFRKLAADVKARVEKRER
jgi:hypothetical protein